MVNIFEFKSKKQIRIEQELEAARRQIEEEKKKAQSEIEREKKKNQILQDESNKLKELLLKQRNDLDHVLNVIKIEQYRQEDELRRKLEIDKHVSEEERYYSLIEIKNRFVWDRKEAVKALSKYKNKQKKSLESDREMSR